MYVHPTDCRSCQGLSPAESIARHRRADARRDLYRLAGWLFLAAMAALGAYAAVAKALTP